MRPTEGKSVEAAEAELGDVLKNFRSSVHAWSEAELGRPRRVMVAEHRHTWHRAAAWALGCVLAAGSLSAGLYEYFRPDQRPTTVASNEAAPPAIAPPAAAAPASAYAAPAHPAVENLMAKVDQDVSRDVPSAMEPLAQLMDESSSQ